jgi:hypothetical protein
MIDIFGEEGLLGLFSGSESDGGLDIDNPIDDTSLLGDGGLLDGNIGGELGVFPDEKGFDLIDIEINQSDSQWDGSFTGSGGRPCANACAVVTGEWTKRNLVIYQ